MTRETKPRRAPLETTVAAVSATFGRLLLGSFEGCLIDASRLMFPNLRLGLSSTLSGYLAAEGCPEFIDLRTAGTLTWLTVESPDHV